MLTSMYLPAARAINGLLAQFWSQTVPVGFDGGCLYTFFFFATGQLVSSSTGHTKLIHFLRTTPLPNGEGCSPRPGAQCGNDPQVKGRLASSSIKGKDCTCTMHRLYEEKRPAVTSIYKIYMRQMA